MLKLVSGIFAFFIVLGMLARSDEPGAPAAAPQPAKLGLFEAPPYQETRLRRQVNGHFYVTAYVNGTPVRFMVDTGASMVALTEEAARAVGLQFSAGEFEPIARTANGMASGKRVILSKVAIEGKEVTGVDGAIVAGAETSLLGQSYLARISGVEMSGEDMILR
jgi:aspartyl protease family protein